MLFPETAPAVAALLADADAAGALGDMGETRWLAVMIAMLGDDAPLVRARVAHALGDLQAPAAIAMLRQHAGDADPEVASEVAWALNELAQ